jgi:glycosyltransferase involved in cell wall biosynthesis
MHSKILLIGSTVHTGGGEVYVKEIFNFLKRDTVTRIEHQHVVAIFFHLIKGKYDRILWVINDDISIFLFLLSIFLGKKNYYISLNIWHTNIQPSRSKNPLKKLFRKVTRHWVRIKQQLFFISSDVSIHLSKYAKTEAEKYFYIKKSDDENIIFGGADKSQFQPVNKKVKKAIRLEHGIDTETTLLLMAGRSDKRKNFIDGLKILSILIHDKQRKWKLLLVISSSKYGNDFEYLGDIFNEISSLGLHKNVYIRSGVPHSEIDSYFKMSDAFLMLSLDNETFGLVTLEALYTGIPVFGYDTCATSEIVPNKFRYLAPKNEYVKVANRIQKYIDKPISKHTIYTRFSWHKTVEKVASLLYIHNQPKQKRSNRFSKLLLLSFSLFLTIIGVTYLSESLFFDRLNYKKSPRFGYIENQEYPLKNIPQNKMIKSRTKDINDLVNDKLVDNPNKQNLLLVGDSFFYGLGVKESKTFPSLIKNKLKRDYDVYNLSLNGDHIVDNYAKIIHAAEQLEPTIIIIGIVSNDLYFHTNNKYKYSYSTYKELSSECKKNVFYADDSLIHQSWEIQTELVHLPTVDDEYANICMLSEITKRLDQLDSKIIYFELSGLKSNQEISENNHVLKKYKYILDKIVLTISKSGAKVIRAGDYPNFSWSTVSKNEGHPSAETHLKYSEILLSEL